MNRRKLQDNLLENAVFPFGFECCSRWCPARIKEVKTIVTIHTDRLQNHNHLASFLKSSHPEINIKNGFGIFGTIE
jgi:hypothetical protein